MELSEELDRENKKAEETIRKTEMRDEIGSLKEEINRTGHHISRELEKEGKKSPAPASDAE
ncbi:MAG: hypothetical protein WC586_11720 [Methanoregula sp.]